MQQRGSTPRMDALGTLMVSASEQWWRHFSPLHLFGPFACLFAPKRCQQHRKHLRFPQGCQWISVALLYSLELKMEAIGLSKSGLWHYLSAASESHSSTSSFPTLDSSSVHLAVDLRIQTIMSLVLPTAQEQDAQPTGFVGSLKANAQDRLRSFKSGLRLGEFSGSLGDLGTLLPIMLSLALTGQVDLTASLIFGGLWNIITGLTFRMPMCVQPMKCKLAPRV